MWTPLFKSRVKMSVTIFSRAVLMEIHFYYVGELILHFNAQTSFNVTEWNKRNSNPGITRGWSNMKLAIPNNFPTWFMYAILKDLWQRNAWECLRPMRQQRMGDEKMISCLLGIFFNFHRWFMNPFVHIKNLRNSCYLLCWKSRRTWRSQEPEGGKYFIFSNKIYAFCFTKAE
jgi:hypothetical protein